MLSTTSAPATALRSLVGVGDSRPAGAQDPSRAPRSRPRRDRRRSCRRPRRGRARRPPSALHDLAEPVAGRTRARRPRSARAWRARAPRARARAAAPRRRARVGSAIAPSQSMTTRSPGPDLGAADDDRHVELPHFALRRALRAHEPRPDRQPDRRELVEVADGAVDEDPRDARAPAPASRAARRRARSAPARRSSARGRRPDSHARRPRAPSCCRRARRARSARGPRRASRARPA